MALPLDALVNLDMATSINHATTLSNDCVAYFNYIMSDITGVLLSFFAVFAYSYLALLRGVNFRTLLILLFALLVSQLSSEPMFASLVFSFTISPDEDHKKRLLEELEQLRTCGIAPLIRRESMEINTLYDIEGFIAVDKIYFEQKYFFAEDFEASPESSQKMYAELSLPHGKLIFALQYAVQARARMANYNQEIELRSLMTLKFCKQLFKCPQLH